MLRFCKRKIATEEYYEIKKKKDIEKIWNADLDN